MGSTKINDRWSRAQSREMALLTQLGHGLINAAHEWRVARAGCRRRARQTPSAAPNALCRAMQADCREDRTDPRADRLLHVATLAFHSLPRAAFQALLSAFRAPPYPCNASLTTTGRRFDRLFDRCFGRLKHLCLPFLRTAPDSSHYKARPADHRLRPAEPAAPELRCGGDNWAGPSTA